MMEQVLIWILCVLLGIALVVGGIWLALRKKKAPPPPPPPPRSPATPPTPPTPVPAPTTTYRSYSWVLLIVGILVAIIAYYAILPALRTSAPSPQVTAPKKELRKHVEKTHLKFLGGEGIFPGRGCVGVLKGGHITFHIANPPLRRSGKYQITFWIIRKTTGRHCMEINGGLGGTFFYENHHASNQPQKIVFFREGVSIDPKYFYPDDNYFKLWSEGDDMIVGDSFIELIYYE